MLSYKKRVQGFLGVLPFFPHHSLPSLIDAFLYDLSITINYKCLVGSAPPALMHPPRRPRALLFKAIWIFAAERELMKRAIKYFTQKMYWNVNISCIHLHLENVQYLHSVLPFVSFNLRVEIVNVR